MPKPILIGSAPRATNTPPLASTSAPTVAPIRAQLRTPHVPYRFIGSFSLRASHGARPSLSEASRRHVYGKPTGNATTNRSRVTAIRRGRARGTLAVLWRQQALQTVRLAAAGDREVADR